MATDLLNTLVTALASVPTVSAKTANLIARQGARVVVNIGETSAELPFIGTTLPPAGHPVQLELRGDQLAVTGPARPLPSTATVTAAPGGPTATVYAWGFEYDLPRRTSYTPVVGDVVELTWSIDGGRIQCAVTMPAIPAVPPAANPAPGPQLFHPAPFTADDSGSFNGGWWTRDVYASDNNAGAYFYGSKISDTIPDGAIIRSAKLYLNPRQEYGYAPNLRVHTSGVRPGGTVSFVGSSTPLASRSGWVDVPLAMIDYLKTSPSGLGFDHGGYNIFRGTNADALAGALDISWES